VDATNIFSGNLYPIVNLFLVEVFRVKKVISETYTSDDVFLNNMSLPMFEKFEKYWGEIGILMSIASILDPQFKCYRWTSLLNSYTLLKKLVLELKKWSKF
jgi:Domain of unknown function (DUF4413)